MNMETLNWKELTERAYQNAVIHGWHEEAHSEYHYMMLVVTELSEAVEADRKGKYAQRVMFEKNFDTPQVNPEEHWKFCFETFIKDSVEDELADAVIRLLDYAGLHDLFIDDEVFTEEQYLDLSESLKDHSFTDVIYTEIRMLSLSKSFTAIVYYLFAIAYHYKIDLLWHIEQKMTYDEMRPYKHGKKY